MYVCAILLAAGKGSRLGSKTSKPMREIMGRPAIVYSLHSLSRSRLIEEIIIVVNKDNSKAIQKLVKSLRINKVKAVVRGGLRRQDSVSRGLAALDPKCDIVLIHDSARPFIEADVIEASIRCAVKCGAAIAAVPVKATVKKVKISKDGLYVDRTLDRQDIWEVQTPQTFRKELLLSAYRKYAGSTVTDDSSLVEKAGIPVKIVKGSYFNIKITTPEDLHIAKAIQEARCKR